MKTNTVVKYRIYPDKDQEQKLRQMFGSCRFLWNKTLEFNNQTHKEIGKFIWFQEGMVQYLAKLKKENDWLYETPAHALLNTLIDLEVSLKAFCKNRSKGQGFPKFKLKQNDHSIRINQINNHISFESSNIKIPKLGLVKSKRSKPLPINSKLKNITIKVEGNNQWFVCCCVEYENQVKEIEFDENKILGLDMGLTTMIHTSDNQTFNHDKIDKRTKKRLKRLQRHISKSIKGSKKKKKKQKKFRKLNQHIVNKRKDNIHKITTAIAKQYDFVAVETLTIKNMVKNHNLASSIHNAAWSQVITCLDYKLKNKGGKLIKIDKWFASTKTCSCCGHTQKMTLKDRVYKCKKCGFEIDRDLNAAINIKNKAKLQNTCGMQGIHAQGQGSSLVEDRVFANQPLDDMGKILSKEKEATFLI